MIKKMQRMVEKKSVVGKELVLSKKLIKAFLDAEFGSRVNVQDVWLDKETKDIHIKVAAIVNKGTNPFREQDFTLVTDSSNYEVKEKFDDKIIQLVQSSNILNKGW